MQIYAMSRCKRFKKHKSNNIASDVSNRFVYVVVISIVSNTSYRVSICIVSIVSGRIVSYVVYCSALEVI